MRLDRIARSPMLLAVLACCITASLAAAPPEFPKAESWAGRSVVVTDSGAWQRYAARKAGGNSELYYVESTDEGRTWSQPKVSCTLPGEGYGGAAALIDRHGELQMFFTRVRREGEGNVPAVNRFIEIWHFRSTDKQTKWTQPVRIFEGYTGAISSAIQMANGRIVMPVGMWIAGRPRSAPFGPHEVTTIYSDDDGATFKMSPSRLISPVSDDYNGDKVGACEPAVVELKDGRVLMHMRTQAGFLYESISSDGINWPAAYASNLYASTGPPCLIRLKDDRILLTWNNCQMPPKVDGKGVYGGRDALHAAIADPGVTRWQGLREIYRDPTRNLEPPKRGDRGTAYPFALQMRDGRVAIMSGQGGRRALMYVDPQWLLEKSQSDDFSKGIDDWCVYKTFGPAEGWWRNRTQGPQLVTHPDKPGAQALHLRKPDDKSADGAVWNFPAGPAGKVSLKFKLAEKSAGGTIALTDRFVDPTDDAGEKEAMVLVPIAVDGAIGNAKLSADKWHTLTFDWDGGDARGNCKISLDGNVVATEPFKHPGKIGLSYLRLRSAAKEVDSAGWYVESVDAAVR